MRITLDDQLIFHGEIARACGGTQGSTDAFGDVSGKLYLFQRQKWG